jgi:hypothetical protein
MTDNHEHVLTPEAFAVLGGGQVAYVREIKPEEVKTLFPQAPMIAPGMKLFSLHAADGTPIIVTDSREAAVANAREHELDMVSVH